MTRCIVNVSVGGDYPRGQARLLRSLETMAPETPRIFWSHWPARSHQECQCGFKVDACDEAARRGYGKVLWLDSQVIAMASLEPVWAWLDEHPMLQLEDGWNVGEWTSDHALKIFGVTRDEAFKMPMSWAKVVGLDLRHPKGLEFLGRWRWLRDNGAFDGPWHTLDQIAWRDRKIMSADPRCRGHRYDQSCSSWLAWDMGLPMAPKADFISTWPDQSGPVFMAKGNSQ